MKITVIIPTYRRCHDLLRCFEALKKQNRPTDEVIVIVRDSDRSTWDFLDTYKSQPLPMKIATVSTTGVVAAMNVGLAAAKGDIISFTDDDAAPHPDWLERIEAHFLADELVGGIGGRDILYRNNHLVNSQRKLIVGRLQWFGRRIGNHHLGIGKAREVDILKGVNMSFRQSAIGELNFDQRMKGTGAQVHFEIAFCLALKRKGWKLIYDPNILVDHYSAKRFDEDQRDRFSYIALVNQVHNETLILLEHLSFLNRIIFILWAICIGNRVNRGFLQCLRFMPSEGLLSGKKLVASFKGLLQGWQTWKQTRVEI